MWYLSRTPYADQHSNPNDSPSTITFHNSIFSVSETGLFQEISIVNVPNTSQTIHRRDPEAHCDKQPKPPCQTTAWEWFAYHASRTQLGAVVVPRTTSTITQLIAILPDRFLCAKLAAAPPQRASLCTYSLFDNSWHDLPKMQCEDRNPFGAAGAILDGWLYLAGGYEGNLTHAEPSTYLNSAERLNLNTWEWQALPSMHKSRAFATGLAHNGQFYVVGGATSKHSAEIYDPGSNTWLSLNTFVPKEAEGFAVTSFGHIIIILTWSDQLGVKLWLWHQVIAECRLLSFFPDNAVERVRFRCHRAKMVRVGEEVWVLMGDSDCVCKVDGPGGWPIFPAPTFRPGVGHKVVREGHIHAFSFPIGGRIKWRKIPVYTI